MCEGMTQTQERKLFRELTLGKEQTVQWYKVLECLADLPDGRQRAGLKRMALSKFRTLIASVEAVAEARKPEIEAESARIKKIREFKEQMKAQGISPEDLGIGSIETAPDKPKRKYEKRVGKDQLTESEQRVFDVLVNKSNSDNVVTGLMPIEIGQICNMETKEVSNKMSKLKSKKYVEGTLSKGVTILKFEAS